MRLTIRRLSTRVYTSIGRGLVTKETAIAGCTSTVDALFILWTICVDDTLYARSVVNRTEKSGAGTGAATRTDTLRVLNTIGVADTLYASRFSSRTEKSGAHTAVATPTATFEVRVAVSVATTLSYATSR